MIQMKTTMRKVHRPRIFRSGDISARSKRFQVSTETIKFPVDIKVKKETGNVVIFRSGGKC